MKKALFMTMLAFGVSAFILMAQDPAKFNGTWKSEKGQVRELTVKDGVVHMREENKNGPLILRQYPFQGQEITMHDGVWADSKAVGHMEGSKMVVDTVMPTGMKWHDEWTMAPDGKSYAALRVLVEQGGGFPNQKGGGAPKAPPAAPPAGGAAKAKAKAPDEPETFTKVQ